MENGKIYIVKLSNSRLIFQSCEFFIVPLTVPFSHFHTNVHFFLLAGERVSQIT